MEMGNGLATGVCCCLLLGSLGSVGASGLPQTESLAQAAAAATTQAPHPLGPEQRADIFMARRDYADAVDYYNRALRQDGLTPNETAALWNKLGIALQQQDDFRSSRKAYKRAVKENPDSSEAWNNLGTTYFFERNYKKSIKYYQHAVALNPSMASFHANLGASYTRIKKYAESVEEYRIALTLDPTILSEHSAMATILEPLRVDADYYYYLAKVFASLGRAPEAVRYLRRAFEDGFTNFKQLDADPDFRKISKDASYVALRRSPPGPPRP
jgi:tetratricopeptide (TPR) repeat protein